jgi:uncharacterized protein
METKPDPAQEKLARLEAALRAAGGSLVAYSGGVDSTFLLAVARRVLGERAVAVTVRTLLHGPGESEDARRRAADLGARHEVIDLDMGAHPEVLANPRDRCYLCKRLVFTALRRRADDLGLPLLADATHVDDLGEWRPGLRALRELGVASPLAEAGLGKAEIRSLTAQLGIEGANRPSSPCLATRVPFDTPLTRERLARVAAAERELLALGFVNTRVRDYGDLARIEVQSGDLERAASAEMRGLIVEAFRAAGYRYVTLDLAGYRTGSMDEAAPEMRHERR